MGGGLMRWTLLAEGGSGGGAAAGGSGVAAGTVWLLAASAGSSGAAVALRMKWSKAVRGVRSPLNVLREGLESGLSELASGIDRPSGLDGSSRLDSPSGTAFMPSARGPAAAPRPNVR